MKKKFWPKKIKMRKQKDIKAYDKLDEIDMVMLEKIIEFPAITDEKLAKIVKLKRLAVNIRRRKPVFHAALIDHLMKPAKDIIKELQPEAARGLRRSLREADPHVRVKAQLGALKPLLTADQTIVIKLEFAQKVIAKVAEVIKKHVPDADTRRKIADELRRTSV